MSEYVKDGPIVAYARTAVRNPTRIAKQGAQMDDYARAQGLPVPVHFADDGVGGMALARPGFGALLKHLEGAGRGGTVLVTDGTRIGRSEPTVREFLGQLERLGSRLVVVSGVHM